MPVVLVPTGDPGLSIFPTHRVFAGAVALPDGGEPMDTVEAALAELERQPHDRAFAVAYADGSARLVAGAEGELDVQLVDRLGHEGISYTPDAAEAVAAVDRGEAALALLLRPTRIEDVFARRAPRRGDAAEVDVLLPEARLRAPVPPRRMTDWLELCRDAMADVDAVLADLPTRVEREPVLRLGEGGDETTAVDAAAEDAVLRRLRELGIPFTVVSEEVGELELTAAAARASSSTRSTAR